MSKFGNMQEQEQVSMQISRHRRMHLHARLVVKREVAHSEACERKERPAIARAALQLARSTRTHSLELSREWRMPANAPCYLLSSVAASSCTGGNAWKEIFVVTRTPATPKPSHVKPATTKYSFK